MRSNITLGYILICFEAPNCQQLIFHKTLNVLQNVKKRLLFNGVRCTNWPTLLKIQYLRSFKYLLIRFGRTKNVKATGLYQQVIKNSNRKKRGKCGDKFCMYLFIVITDRLHSSQLTSMLRLTFSVYSAYVVSDELTKSSTARMRDVGEEKYF